MILKPSPIPDPNPNPTTKPDMTKPPPNDKDFPDPKPKPTIGIKKPDMTKPPNDKDFAPIKLLSESVLGSFLGITGQRPPNASPEATPLKIETQHNKVVGNEVSKAQKRIRNKKMRQRRRDKARRRA